MTAKKQSTKAEQQTPATVAKAPQAPKPAVPTPTSTHTPTTPPQATANKQSQTVAKLKEAWTAKGINLDQLSERQDGKFILLQPTPAWPIIRIGPTGGIELPAIRSYSKAWDAALIADQLWTKQQQRDQKKANSATPAPAQTKPQPPAPQVKSDTPAAKKAKDHQKLEASLA